MKHSLLLILFLLICALKVSATHIVGGEFELQHQQGYNYKLTLNLYFDEVNGQPGALDELITVNFFEKSTNRRIGFQQMYLKSKTDVPYTNIDCAFGGLVTSKIVYHETIYFDPNLFNSPAGYYVTWERCCRNGTINNIVSPEAAAQTFYMEFPAVVQNNKQFINSSPRLFPPLSDYACLNELFYFDFSGSDSDGDSLVYDMVTPLNGYTTTAMPAYGVRGYEYVEPKSAPYPTVRWLAGYGNNTQIKGNPPMNIDSKTGRLTMRPNQKGLFVFGVRVQEFRGGKKIGEVRRDFQVLVLDCPRNDAPKVLARKQGSKTYYQKNQTISINADGNRCIDVFYTDPDLSEFVKLKAIPVNFTAKDFTLSGQFQGVINRGVKQDTLKAQICFAECFDVKRQIYEIDLVVEDDGCSLPKTDTLRIKFEIIPVPNQAPVLTSDQPNQIVTLKRGEPFNMKLTGRDADMHKLTLSAAGNGFNLTQLGMNFNSTGGLGTANGEFSWTPECNAVEQSVRRVTFTLKEDACNPSPDQKITIEFRISAPNNVPLLTSDKQQGEYEMELDESFEANLTGTDIDLDPLQLVAVGNGFTLEEMGMTFIAMPGNGFATGKFTFKSICKAAERGILKVDFILKEQACNPAPEPVHSISFKIKLPKLADYKPANIFTPNGDGKNDFFEMPGLPLEFCSARFEHIKVFNRWGAEVYSSTSPNFKWDGKGVNDGVYYYVIEFGSTRYKGSVTIVR
jgi:gliding motility-associated-like protein